MVMRKHQRYFPVFEAASPTSSPSTSSGGNGGAAAPPQRLLPFFVTVANGPVVPSVVAAGNEAVLRARFEDATFFYREDLKSSLEQLRCGTTKHSWQQFLIHDPSASHSHGYLTYKGQAHTLLSGGVISPPHTHTHTPTSAHDRPRFQRPTAPRHATPHLATRLNSRQAQAVRHHFPA